MNQEMRRPWQPDIELGTRQVRDLVDAHFPDLRGHPIARVGAGWDVSVFECAGQALRFPRRKAFVGSIGRETTVLPNLPELPLPVPEVLEVVPSGIAFPHPFWRGTLIAGQEIAEADLTAEQRVRIAAQMGEFLRVLHSAAVPEALRSLPIDPNDRADMTKRSSMAAEALGALRDRGVGVGVGMGDRAAQLAGIPYKELSGYLSAGTAVGGSTTRPMLLHGDLHIRHVLVAQGSVAGIIDWGDSCLGDPSIDLSLAFGAFEKRERDVFLGSYGPVGEKTLLRARVVATSLCAALALYADDENLPKLFRESVRGLHRCSG